MPVSQTEHSVVIFVVLILVLLIITILVYIKVTVLQWSSNIS